MHFTTMRKHPPRALCHDKRCSNTTQWSHVPANQHGHKARFRPAIWDQCIRCELYTNQHRIGEFSDTYRSLLPHQIAPASSLGGLKEVTSQSSTSHQCELYRSLKGSAGRYPMDLALARK